MNFVNNARVIKQCKQSYSYCNYFC